MVKRHYDQSELLNYVELDKNTKTLKDKVILLHLDSFCLGDTICFASFIDSFVEFHNPKKVIVSTFFPHLLISNNERCKIINANQNKKLTIDKLIDVGYDKNNLSHTLGGMLYATKDTMMIPQSTKPKKPTLIPKKRNIISNKITIAPESLKSIAQWDKDGWQKIVDVLVKNGFDVFNVSYEDTLKLNDVKGYHGFDDINVSLNHILESRLFIGLSSGLSWLAWAYDVPVVMISGFTKEHNEFDCFRVINKSVCNGCFNLFPNIDTKCPIFLNTDRENECHKKITPEMVITQINNALLFTTQQ
jgi:autotransporter strand-loop-strand O-heptosyltransferase